MIPKCVFCIYEIGRWGKGHSALALLVTNLSPATQIINTPTGERHVCDAHAKLGTWRKQLPLSGITDMRDVVAGKRDE